MESIWTAETKIPERDPLPGDLKTEVAVIGAGLTGILTAWCLQQAGRRVVVLEADRIGSGQTKNTTAKITSQHNLLYARLIHDFGSGMAEHYARANEAAIEAYEKLIEEKHIDCDFIRCPACLYSRKERAPLEREVKAAQALGIRASFETDSELPFPVAGVARFEGQARFRPLSFLAALAEELTVYEQTRVLRVVENRVETARGCVQASAVVFAAHFPFPIVPGYYFARMYQERSYVLAVENAEVCRGMYLGMEKDSLSVRPQGDLLLLGGGGHRTGANRQGGQYDRLRSAAEMYYPGCREVAHWSAQDCMTLDGIPYIGRFSRRNPEWYVATGFGKWGMTSAMVSARILSALLTGQDCPEADIFSPQRRFTARAAGKLAGHSAHTVKGLSKRLLPAGAGKPHSGEVIPNCPHMGCRLEWNPEEGSYDCPCHGSRFDREGRLTDGPAQTDCPRRGQR